MGVGCGVSAVMAKLTMGLYRGTKLQAVTIYVDGELIRYKGMTQDNLTRSDAEESIAQSSYTYLASLRQDIERHLQHKATEVVVYMDGERVINKTTDRSPFKFDAGLVRRLFGNLCENNDMRMIWLDKGEAEMQMYRCRNRDNDLNVFVSADSDLIPIMYGHKVTVTEGANVEWTMPPTTTREYHRIKDYNRKYVDGQGIRDSCLWIRCIANIEAYGMDDTVKLIGMNPLNFRITMALCGTDFTCSAFTDTMVQTILLAYSDDSLRCQLELLESQTDIMRIVAGLIYLAVSHGCTLKRGDGVILPGDTVALRETFEHTEHMLRTYVNYLETGEMDDDIVQPPGVFMVRLCLFAMANWVKLTRGDLIKWTQRVLMGPALANFDRNRDDANIRQLAIDSFAKPKSRKRKHVTIDDVIIMRKRLQDSKANISSTGSSRHPGSS